MKKLSTFLWAVSFSFFSLQITSEAVPITVGTHVVTDEQIAALMVALPKFDKDREYFHWMWPENGLRWAAQGKLDAGEVKFYNDFATAVRDVVSEIEAHFKEDYLKKEFAAITNKSNCAFIYIFFFINISFFNNS